MRPRLSWLFCAALLLGACSADSQGTATTATALPIGTLPSSPPAADPVTVTTQPAEVYVLQAGDSPLEVARQFGLTLEELDAYNADIAGYRSFVVGAVVWVSPPPTTVPTTPPAPFQPTPGLVTMTLTGAITPDEGVLSDATDREGNLDFWPQVARIAATTASSDLTICHLTDAEAPDELLIAMAFAGFDRCSNPAGPPLAVGDTIADTPDFDVNGVVVAHLAYSGSLSAEEITSDAAAERDAGAEVVVVTIEWGGAADLLPTAAERTLVQEITSTGAIDLVVGQSPLLRGVEQVNGVWVLWGLGGLLTSGQPGGSLPPAAEDAAIVTVRFARGLDGAITVHTPVVHATWCDREGGHVVRPTGDLGDASLAPEVRVALQRSDTRSRATMGALLAG